MQIKKTMLRFLIEESGQTTTEYILILAVIVTIFMQFRSRLGKIVTKILDQLDARTNNLGYEDGSGIDG